MLFRMLAACILAGGLAAQTAAPDTVQTSAGALAIAPVQSVGVELRWAGKVIEIDPVGAANYAQRPKADLILVTNTGPDHLDAAAIGAVLKDGTILIAPAAVAADPQVAALVKTPRVLAPGEFTAVNVRGLGFAVQAVGQSRLRGSPPGGSGFVLTLGDKRVYLSGDTACTAEIRALRAIDIAFFSLRPPGGAGAVEAAACVADFHPGKVYPYHGRPADAAAFAAARSTSAAAGH